MISWFYHQEKSEHTNQRAHHLWCKRGWAYLYVRAYFYKKKH